MSKELTDDQKAAYIMGMVRAFNAVGWPEHFDEDALTVWRERAHWAAQMLDGGAYSPSHVWAVRGLFDDEHAEI